MSRTWVFSFLFAVLAPFAAAQPAADAVFGAGDTFLGRTAFTGDVDVVIVEALPGAPLKLVVAAEPKAKVAPRLEVFAGGQSLLTGGVKIKIKKKGRKQIVSGLLAPPSGQVEVRISAASAALGEYRLRTREVLPTKWKATLQGASAAAGGVVPFVAPAGASLTLRLRAPGAGAAEIALPSLASPGGTIDLEPFVASATGKTLVVGPVPLTAGGAYVLHLGVLPAGAKKLVVRGNLALPAGAAAEIQEPPGHAVVEGAVALADGYWLDQDAEALADEVLVRFAPGPDRAAALALELGLDVVARGGDGWVRLRAPGIASFATARGAGRARLRDLVERAAGRPDVLRATPNFVRRSFAVPSDPLFASQWDMAVPGFPAAWDSTPGDAQRLVAVLDTGIRAEHPDLAGRLAPGYDFVGDPWNAGDSTSYDPNPKDEFVHSGTHGTHVTGTVAAAASNGIGVAGATHLGRVMPVRVLGVLGGTDFDIAQGVLWAAGLDNVSGTLPAQRAEVVNLSLGGPTYSAILHDAVRRAVDAGVVVVAAAGNSNSNKPMYPAAFAEVVAVAATDAADKRAYYSSYGGHLDLAAPGGDMNKDKNGDGAPDGVLSTIVDPGLGPTWGLKSGTSMAAPHVAAAAFLVRSVRPELSPLEVEAYLAASAVDLGAAGPDPYFGHGRLDAAAAVALAAGEVSGPSTPFVLPHAMHFAADVDERPLAVVDQTGSSPLHVTGTHANKFWVQAEMTASVAPCSLTVRVERAGLAPGVYEAELVVETDAGAKVVPVSMAVQGTGQPIGVQSVFVLAYDLVSKGVTLVQVVTEDSADAFTLDPLAEGTYRIFASTDLDFDGVVGEPHDYTGLLVDPETGSSDVVLVDGEQLGGVSISLATGNGAGLPGGGIALELPE